MPDQAAAMFIPIAPDLRNGDATLLYSLFNGRQPDGILVKLCNFHLHIQAS